MYDFYIETQKFHTSLLIYQKSYDFSQPYPSLLFMLSPAFPSDPKFLHAPPTSRSQKCSNKYMIPHRLPSSKLILFVGPNSKFLFLVLTRVPAESGMLMSEYINPAWPPQSEGMFRDRTGRVSVYVVCVCCACGGCIHRSLRGICLLS